MYYIQVNIGRNYTDKQGQLARHSDKQWQRMEYLVFRALRRFTGSTAYIECHEGSGYWNGISEESKHFSIVAEDVEGAELRAFMAKVASLYQQDAIGVIISDNSLVNRDGLIHGYDELLEMVE